LSGHPPGELSWPPKKKDLERLYLVDKLSAMRIAEAYGLKYKTPKVAESTILYHLKRNGIKRRNSVELSTKFNEETVDEWVRRYQEGESLKEIAGGELSPVTVFSRLRKRGMKLRDKVEAQIQAVSKYERKPFSGDKIEKAYLVGLRYGDLDAVRHGRAIRVRVSTTHPAMAELFESLLSPFGMVHRYPRKAQFTGYEWTLECDLDSSFEFLLKKPRIAELELLGEGEFSAFLAGFFDAEGSLFLHQKSSGPAPEANITNTDRDILVYLASRLFNLGIFSKLSLSNRVLEETGFNSILPMWRLDIWRFESVRKLARAMRLRHAEKVAKASLAVRFVAPISRAENYALSREWENRAAEFERDRKGFVEEARKKIEGTDY